MRMTYEVAPGVFPGFLTNTKMKAYLGNSDDFDFQKLSSLAHMSASQGQCFRH